MSEPVAPLLASLLAEQRAVWDGGGRCFVEALLRQYPDLASDTEGVLDLIYNEVFLRERKGETPQCAEYLQRFPHLADEIRLQFDVHQAIGADDSSKGPSLPSTEENVEATGNLPVIPGYEVLAEIGGGGVGRVYKARDKSADGLVAVKVLRPEYRGRKAVRRRFLVEARAAAALDHPHILKVLQAGECADGPYFVMELIDGVSLEEVIRGGLPEVARVVRWLGAVTDAVKYIHEKGIIHHDLKPANILIDAADCPRITDCGMANFFWQTGMPRLSSAHQGIQLGTPCYKAPEQFDDVKAGPASDVYSLGAILYELLTGRPPFDEGNFVSTVLKVRSKEEPPSVRSLSPDVPELLDLICQNCLSKHPADRYRSARELAGALRRFTRVDAPPTALLTLVSRKTGKLIPVVQEITIVGRSAECDVILEKPDVSRVHCQIIRTADEVFVEDLGSARGTRVNGLRVKRSRLVHGDELKIARQLFQVVLAIKE